MAVRVSGAQGILKQRTQGHFTVQAVCNSNKEISLLSALSLPSHCPVCWLSLAPFFWVAGMVLSRVCNMSLLATLVWAMPLNMSWHALQQTIKYRLSLSPDQLHLHA